jgi:hypothetical protein
MGCGGREDLLDPQALDAAAKGVSPDGIAIAEEMGGGVAPLPDDPSGVAPRPV